MKENIILPENLFKLDFFKMDMWSLGFIIHKVITKDLPSFDPTRKPILNKVMFSPAMHDLVMRCLSLTPNNRPNWQDINLRDLNNSVVVEDFDERERSSEKEVIKLGTSK